MVGSLQKKRKRQAASKNDRGKRNNKSKADKEEEDDEDEEWVPDENVDDKDDDEEVDNDGNKEDEIEDDDESKEKDNNKEDEDDDDDDDDRSEQSKKKKKWMSRRAANSLLADSELAISRALEHLKEAQELANRAGLTVDSSILPSNDPSAVMDPTTAANATTLDPSANQAATTTPAPVGWTGGHSNTDHMVVQTGDEKLDRIAELKRNLLRRYRAMQPENRGEDRWDKPRIPGERRRRIVRERDLPQAPPEPPCTGFVLFVGQMTTKIRHDRPNVPHDQTRVVQEISKLWRMAMSEDDRNYYNEFSTQARAEYDSQVIQYRATGSFQPSKRFQTLPNTNVWIPILSKNNLEDEISNYTSFQFPKRPPELDEAYEYREVRSKFRRKLKIKGMLSEDGTLKDSSLDFEALFAQDQEKQKQQQQVQQQQQQQEQQYKNQNDESNKKDKTERSRIYI